MPDVTINVGGRSFDVACQDGEEHYLHAAAKMLDDEAQVLTDQVGRMPEARMLLMAGLMLADKTASVEDRVREVESTLAEREAEMEGLRAGGGTEPQKIEVPVIPESVTASLSELAAKAEAVATEIESKAASSPG